jgi:hypothetical protein
MCSTRVITILLSIRAEESTAFYDPSHFPHVDQHLHLMQKGDLNLSKKNKHHTHDKDCGSGSYWIKIKEYPCSELSRKYKGQHIIDFLCVCSDANGLMGDQGFPYNLDFLLMC